MFTIDNNAIQIVRGDSGSFTVSVKNADGTAYSLGANDVVKFTVKKSVKDTRELIVKTGTTITLIPSDTANLDFGKYVYDVQVTLADGTVDTIITPSTFTILPEVG